MVLAAFVTFSAAHIAALLVIALVSTALALWGRCMRPRRRRAVGRALAALLVCNEAIYYFWTSRVYGPRALLESFLPLHLCGAAVFLLAWTAWRRSAWTFEMAYYWGLGGTTQALLTPNLQAGFPSYHFWQYFLTHGGIVIVVTFFLAAWQMRPRKGSVLRVFLATNAYMLMVAVVNVVLRGLGLDANYMFLCRRPEGASPFFFLPWPWYILFLEAFALLTVSLLYLPWSPGRRGGGGGCQAEGLRGLEGGDDR
jgi:hypothetical integral membrane protein (TIGR02206 family)